MSKEASEETVVVVVPQDDFAGMCETFCDSCGSLRLWLRKEYPKACGNCGAPDPLVGGVGGSVLPIAREQWLRKQALLKGGETCGKM